MIPVVLITFMESCLSSSRFIAFFDECGDHSLVRVDRDFPLFLLCTVLVERDSYVRDIIPAIAAFKLRYFAHEGINLHSRDIRKAEGPFTILQNTVIREEFLNGLSNLIASLPFMLFITAIRKYPYIDRYGIAARNPYDVALEFSFERILRFLETCRATQLPVIAEARGKLEDDELRDSFQSLLALGTTNIAARRFQTLESPISFRRKADNICGIQLADLCAFPTARRVLAPEVKNRAFEAVAPHFEQPFAGLKGQGQGRGCLKVFPKENGRHQSLLESSADRAFPIQR